MSARAWAAVDSSTLRRCASRIVRRRPGAANGTTRNRSPATVRGTTAKPRPARTASRTASISPPSTAKVGENPASRQAASVVSRQVVAGTEHHQRPALELGHGDPLSATGRAGGRRRRDDHEPLGEERQGGQLRVVTQASVDHQGEVQRSLGQPSLEVAEPPSWIASSTPGWSRWNPASTPGSSPVQRLGVAPSRTRPRVQLQHLPDPTTGGVGVSQHSPGHRQQRLPGVGQRHVPPGPLEQGCTQLPFEGPHLLGKGRLGDPHLIGRPGEVPGVGHGHEIGQLLQLHRFIIVLPYCYESHHVFDL